MRAATKVENRTVQIQHTEEQREVLVNKLLEDMGDLRELEEEKSSYTSTMNGKIKVAEADIDELRHRIQRGYDEMYKTVTVEMHPEEGVKHFYLRDTGEYVGQAEMEPQDYNLEMTL